MEKLFEEVVDLADQGLSLRKISKITGISQQKARRILISNDAWSSPQADEIAKLVASGLTVDEISEKLHLSRSIVISYLPYKKGPYYSDDPSINALRVRKCRDKKSAK